jgi:hypothetical protein
VRTLEPAARGFSQMLLSSEGKIVYVDVSLGDRVGPGIVRNTPGRFY